MVSITVSVESLSFDVHLCILSPSIFFSDVVHVFTRGDRFLPRGAAKGAVSSRFSPQKLPSRERATDLKENIS